MGQPGDSFYGIVCVAQVLYKRKVSLCFAHFRLWYVKGYLFAQVKKNIADKLIEEMYFSEVRNYTIFSTDKFNQTTKCFSIFYRILAEFMLLYHITLLLIYLSTSLSK